MIDDTGVGAMEDVAERGCGGEVGVDVAGDAYAEVAKACLGGLAVTDLRLFQNEVRSVWRVGVTDITARKN